MMRWWRSHSIRVRLTLWYIAAMIIVLGVYAAAVLAFLHWLWIRLDNVPAYAHFVPLAALETFRLWYNFARPSRRRLPE